MREASASRHFGQVHARPTRVDELAVRLLEPFRRRHGPVLVQHRAHLIARPVRRSDHLREESTCFGENPHGGVGIGVLETVEFRHSFEVGDVAEHELHVGDRGGVFGHVNSLEVAGSKDTDQTVGIQCRPGD